MLLNRTHVLACGMVAAAIAVSNVSFAEVFNLRVTKHPIVLNETCDDFAYSEAKRLEGFVGESLRTVEARCFDDDVILNNKSWNYDIRYEAPQRLNLVSTFDEYSILSPGYKTQKDCDLARVEENVRFEKHTGLKAFHSFCRVPTFSSGAWMLAVESFGNAAIKPFSTSTVVYGPALNYTGPQFKDLIRGRLAMYESDLAQIVLGYGPANGNLAIRYYGATRFHVEETRFARYETAKACLDDVGALTSGLDDAEAVSLGSYCHPIAMSSVIELASLTNRSRGVRAGSTQVVYDSRAQCEAAKPNVIQHYRTDLGRDVKAGLCSLKSGKFEMILVEKQVLPESSSVK